MIHKFSVSFSFFRALKGFFTSRRGLQQGDHLSLLLFILSEEVSSRVIKKLLYDEKIQPIKILENAYLTHLLFIYYFSMPY